MSPGGVLVVVGVVDETTVEDADQQGHDLTVELGALAFTVLTGWRLGDQPHSLGD